MLGTSEIHELLERHGLDARRSLGQNFVTDPGVVRRIARLAGVGPGDRVVEVGPGLGSLTLALAETGARVVVVEKDRRLLPVLREVLGRVEGPVPEVVEADALELDWAGLLDGGPWVLVANLPYNVAVPIILGVLGGAPMVERLVVMVQREVADRLCATPGGRTIGVPTVKVAWYASARMIMSVAPEVFTPRPRVQSAVVEITRRPEPPAGDRERAFALVERAYQQRRKMLRTSLATMADQPQLVAAGIAPTARPEELDVAQWAALAAVCR
jgi:16S rRNA (adenine1518-N6/adenine1519-N6)-dimethyltransferase